MSYTPINWDEYTPITATNLDIMDSGIANNEEDLRTIQGGETEVDGRITTDENDISTNSNNISSNESDISSLETEQSNQDGRISTNEDDIASNESRISTNENDIDVIETVSGTVNVAGGFTEDITHNLGSENVVVTVAAEYDDDFFATSQNKVYGYNITDSNNIRIHNGSTDPHTFRYTVTRTG